MSQFQDWPSSQGKHRNSNIVLQRQIPNFGVKLVGEGHLVSKIGEFSILGKVQSYKYNGINGYLMMNINSYFNYLSNQFVHLSVT